MHEIRHWLREDSNTTLAAYGVISKTMNSNGKDERKPLIPRQEAGSIPGILLDIDLRGPPHNGQEARDAV